jgi:tetratricopeptide (TPR) repeat protein
MGIPIKGGKHGMPKGRSYAKYKPPKNNPNRNDPFRIVLYIVLIAVFGWAYFNQDQVQALLLNQAQAIAAEEGPAQPGQPSGEGVAGIGRGKGTTPAPDMTTEDAAALARDAYNAGNLEDAIDYYLQAAELNSSEPTYPVEAARLLVYQSGLTTGEEREALLQRALEAAQQAQRAAPESPEGYAIAGKVLDWQGQPDSGRNLVTRALSIDENYALGHSYLAEILIDLDLPEQANESIQKAIALTPEGNVDVLRDYAYVLENQGLYNDAALQYEQAIALNPRLPYLRLSLARAYRFISPEPNCEGAIEQLLAAQPQARGSTLLAFELGVTYESCQGDFPAALDTYRQTLEIDETYRPAWLRIAEIEYYQQNYETSINAYEQAIELGARDVQNERLQLVITWQLGYSYAAEGQCTQATPYLEEAQELAGEDNEAIADVVQQGFDLCAEE